MITTLQKWGNSQGVRLPKALLDEIGLEVGAEVEVVAEDRTITIRPRNPGRRPGKYTIDDLVRGTPKDFQPGEVDWGPPVGEEVW